MAEHKSNEAHFFLFVNGLDSGALQVTDFHGVDRLNAPYWFEITVISSDAFIDPAAVVNKRASLFIARDGEYYPYSGIVSQFRFVDRSTDHATYAVRLVPALWLLSLNCRNRVFQKMTVPDIVAQVLDETGLADNCEQQIEKSYPEHEFVVQYQESDLNFICRLMQSHGISYFFREVALLREELDGEPVTESLVLSDKPSSFTDIGGESTLLYRSRSGMHERFDDRVHESVDRIAATGRVLPADVFVKNYNYRTPEVALSASAEVAGGAVGTVYRYGGDYKDTDGASVAAQRLSGRIAGEQITVEGGSDCRGMRAGHRFTLSEHGREELNTTYVLTQVTHSGSQFAARGAESGPTYENRFRATPGSQAEYFVPELEAAVPRIPGIMTAMIETNGSEYASLDDMGRYKIRLPFDISDADNYQASKYIRLAQPYAGSNYGMHFPSHEGAEMVLACVDGDPNKPLGLGTVPNANTLPPVVSSNKEQGVLRTAGNNELLMDDTDGKQRVRLSTCAAHALEMDDGERRVTLRTTDENALLLDDKNERCTLKSGEHNIDLSYKGGEEGVVITTAGGHVIRIDDSGKKVTIQSNAGHIVQMDDNGKKMSLSDCNGKNTVTLDGNKGLILDSSGKISINATQDLEIKAANIKMEAGTGKIEAKATQDLNLSGLKINGKANTDVKLEGMNVGMKGTIGAKLEGLNTEVKGQVQTKVSGTMAELSGSAMTTVKGGIVMIN